MNRPIFWLPNYGTLFLSIEKALQLQVFLKRKLKFRFPKTAHVEYVKLILNTLVLLRRV